MFFFSFLIFQVFSFFYLWLRWVFLLLWFLLEAWALEHRFSSCGAQDQLLRGMWSLPGPGMEPVSPALAFLSTEPPGKP